jgi:hypothetical protein
LHFGGAISEQFELVGMRRQVLTFEKPPSFTELVARVKAVINVRCDLCLHGRCGMSGNRPIYVMLPLGFEDEWKLYKSYARQSRLKGAECWGCKVELASEFPTELYLTCCSFTSNVTSSYPRSFCRKRWTRGTAWGTTQAEVRAGHNGGR